ncbi:MAG: oligosaccharide flippase family protein, partial [Dehalococcoidia bacterium]
MSKTEIEGTGSAESTLLTSLLRNTAQQGLIYFIGVVVTGLAGFLVLPIYARIFAPAEYGLLNLTLLVVSMGSIVMGNWLTSCTTRFLPYYQRIHKTDTFYSTVLLSMILALAAFLILGIPAYFLLLHFFTTEFQPLIPLVAALIPLTMVFMVSLSILRIKQETKRYVIFQIGSTYLALMIGVPLVIFLGLGVSGILLGQASILLVLGAIMFKRLFITRSSLRPSVVSLAGVKEFAIYGFPAASATIGTLLLSGADRYVIEYFRGTAEVGLYSMGYAISTIITMLVRAFMLTTTPTLMLTYESENREITSRLLSQLTRIFLLIGLPAAIGISVLADPVVKLLTTAPYHSTSTVIPFVALGNFVYGLCLLSYTGLQTAKKSIIMARNWFTAGVFNIV